MSSPQRTCVGCRLTAAADDLLRITLDGAGKLVVGPGVGRGAWLCRPGPACLELAAKRRALARALRRPVAVEAVNRLRDVLEGLVCEDVGPHSHAVATVDGSHTAVED